MSNEMAIPGQRFRLGQVVMTRGVMALCEERGVDLHSMLRRHAQGDFGTVGLLDSAVLTEDVLENGALATSDDLLLSALAVKKDAGMVMSVYQTDPPNSTRIWIQTILADEETYTTLLLPSEY